MQILSKISLSVCIINNSAVERSQKTFTSKKCLSLTLTLINRTSRGLKFFSRPFSTLRDDILGSANQHKKQFPFLTAAESWDVCKSYYFDFFLYFLRLHYIVLILYYEIIFQHQYIRIWTTIVTQYLLGMEIIDLQSVPEKNSLYRPLKKWSIVSDYRKLNETKYSKCWAPVWVVPKNWTLQNNIKFQKKLYAWFMHICIILIVIWFVRNPLYLLSFLNDSPLYQNS